MPHRHPAYPEESQKLSQNCGEIARRIRRLEEQETESFLIAKYGAMDIQTLTAAIDSPYFMRLKLKYDDGTVKDVCFGENVHDISLRDTYICGVGSPLRQQIQHRTVREVHISTPSGTRTVYQQLRRQLGIEEQVITALSDIMPLAEESVGQADETDVFVQLGQEYLLKQLDREASAKARSILATISERQDELMTWPTEKLLVVNGVAGSGKTAIAYHRIPTLLHKERAGSKGLEEQKIAVFVPNPFLLSYLRQLLPKFGVGDVFQTTFEDWAKRVINRGDRRINQLTDETASVIFDPKSTPEEKKAAWAKAKLRGRQEMQEVLRHLVAEEVNSKLLDVHLELPMPLPTPSVEEATDDFLDTDMFGVSSEREEAAASELETPAPAFFTFSLEPVRTLTDKWRNQPAQVGWISLRAELQAELLRLTDGGLPKAFKKLAKEQGVPAHIWQEHQERLQAQLRALSENLLPEGNVWETYLALVANKKNVEQAVARVFTGKAQQVAVQALYRPARPSKKGETAFETTDITELPLVLALKILLEGVQPNDQALRGRFGNTGAFQYLIIDEGQDLSALQYALLSRYSQPGQAAIFGDLRQGIHRYRGIDDWSVVLDALGTGTEKVEELTQTFRTTQEITELGNFVLEEVMPSALKAEAVPRPGRPVHFVRYASEQPLVPLLTHEVRRLQREGAKNIGIITRSPSEATNIYQRVKSAGANAFKVDSRTQTFEDYTGGIAIVPIGVAKGLEFDAAIVLNADREHFSPDTPYDGSLLYTSVTRGLHHLTLFAKGEFTPLLGQVPPAVPGKCSISGLEISAAGFHKPPTYTTGRARQKGQERGPGANQHDHVRTYDGRFESTPSYEGDGSRDNPWYDR